MQLTELGVQSASATYAAIRNRVEQWSFQSGGTKLTVPELRHEILKLCGLSRTAVTGSLLIKSLVDDLQPVGNEEAAEQIRGNFPSWTELRSQSLWHDDATLAICETRLRDHQLLFIVGPSGTGKTVLARSLCYRLWSERHEPSYWDFEHLGGLPSSPADRKISCRYWHKSLANLYWEAFQLYGDEFARSIRTQLSREARET